MPLDEQLLDSEAELHITHAYWYMYAQCIFIWSCNFRDVHIDHYCDWHLWIHVVTLSIESRVKHDCVHNWFYNSIGKYKVQQCSTDDVNWIVLGLLTSILHNMYWYTQCQNFWDAHKHYKIHEYCIELNLCHTAVVNV